MFKCYQKGSLKLFAGTVEGDPRFTERDGIRVAVITLRDYNDERIDIYFKNGPEGSPKGEMRADRIEVAKVADGSYMTVLASCSDPEEKTATGIDLKYRGRWTFKGENGVTSVLVGPACNPRLVREGLYSVTIPVDDFLNGEKRTLWVDVVFFDGEYKGKPQENAKFASRVLYQHEEDKPIVVITGGNLREREYNGRTYYSMVGYRISRKPS